MALAVSPLVRICAADVAALPDLRIVAATSTGYDHIDVAAVVAAGACVTHTPGYSDIEVADHVIAMTGALLRRLHVADAMMRHGRYSSRAAGARRITGSTLGVVGLGRIGTLVAQRGLSLGMRVLAISCVTNMAAGILPQKLDHKEVLEAGYQVRDTLIRLLKALLPKL